MSQSVERAKSKELKQPFVWKTQYDEFIPVNKMGTRHLFNTVRMIWNHFMPEDARLHPYKRYSHFGPHYTYQYIEKAIRSMLPELARRRHQLSYWQLDQLDKMLSWLLLNDAEQEQLGESRNPRIAFNREGK